MVDKETVVRAWREGRSAELRTPNPYYGQGLLARIGCAAIWRCWVTGWPGHRPGRSSLPARRLFRLSWSATATGPRPSITTSAGDVHAGQVDIVGFSCGFRVGRYLVDELTEFVVQTIVRSRMHYLEWLRAASPDAA